MWCCVNGTPLRVRLTVCVVWNAAGDFSEEECSSLKMILGSKHVGAILNVLTKPTHRVSSYKKNSRRSNVMISAMKQNLDGYKFEDDRDMETAVV